MEKVTVEVICFAGLRKYFGRGIKVSVEPGVSYSDIIDEMTRMKPDAEEVLATCRIAVNEEFIAPKEKIRSERTLILIPPSSGG
jgi:molybdopterin converting factor small subunit